MERNKPLKKFTGELIFGFIISALLLYGFVNIAESLLYKELADLDTAIMTFIHSFGQPFVTKLFIFITHIGSAITEVIIFIFALLLLLKWKHYAEAVVLSFSILGGWFLNQFLKRLYSRSRPEFEHLVDVGGFSFPSGHAMVSMTFYGMLATIIVINLKERNRKYNYIIVLAISLIFFIGLSRVYLKVHYPSDVIAGFFAGGVWLTTCIIGLSAIRFYNGWKKREK